jgi:D-glycero-D-manno-heptose 1,7-bisphosphate phosphatase
VLAEHGAKVNAFYHCPHHPEGLGEYREVCACRKPRPGMLLAAARDLGIDLSRSWMIGDKLCDAQAGLAAGCRALLVRTGHGAELTDAVEDLAAAVAIVLQSPARAPAA